MVGEMKFALIQKVIWDTLEQNHARLWWAQNCLNLLLFEKKTNQNKPKKQHHQKNSQKICKVFFLYNIEEL